MLFLEGRGLFLSRRIGDWQARWLSCCPCTWDLVLLRLTFSVTPLNVLRIGMRGRKSQLVEVPRLRVGRDAVYRVRYGSVLLWVRPAKAWVSGQHCGPQFRSLVTQEQTDDHCFVVLLGHQQVLDLLPCVARGHHHCSWPRCFVVREWLHTRL